MMTYKLEDGELVVVSGEWPTNNIDAIKECINKFDTIKRYLEVGVDVYNTGEVLTCALCHLYHGYFIYGIEKCSYFCPIKKKTGRNGCGGTPYDLLAQREKKTLLKIEDVDKEIEFLKEVLTEELGQPIPRWC